MPIHKRTPSPVTSQAKSKAILAAIAEGIHPKTKEELPGNSIVNDIDVNRAIRAGISAIEQVEARAARRAQLPSGVGNPWSVDEERTLAMEYSNGVHLEDM